VRYGRRRRLETVDNAVEQGKTAASNICGKAARHEHVPWFWSDQFDLKLQTAGISAGYDATVVRGDPADRAFSVVYLKQGRVLALEDPGSTTAIFLPRMCLSENIVAVQRLDSFKQRPAPDKVGYVFSRQEINSSVWVHKGLVDAGAFNNQDWNKSDHMYKNMREGMKIIYRSDPIPRAFELVRTDLDPSIKERLKAILLKAHRDGNAQKALREYQSTRQFDEMDLNSIRALRALREALLDNLKVLR
jgi:ABC-type phosphate/phosphonate transport system substrate-binding protein